MTFLLEEIMPAPRGPCVVWGDWEKLDSKTLEILRQYAYARVVSDRYGALYPMTFGKWRLNLGRLETITVVDACYCYASVLDAVDALEGWNGTDEPSGWFRCPTDGRRRPDGDASREYVRE